MASKDMPAKPSRPAAPEVPEAAVPAAAAAASPSPSRPAPSRALLMGRRRGLAPADLAENVPLLGEAPAKPAASDGPAGAAAAGAQSGPVPAPAPHPLPRPTAAAASGAIPLPVPAAGTAAATQTGTALRPATGHALEIVRPAEPPVRMPPPLPPRAETEPEWRAAGPLWAGVAALVALIGGLGLWGTQARLSRAVVSSGLVNVETNRQVIQHPDGGVVGAIIARDGDRVAAGDVLLRLDGTRLQSELAVIEGQLHELAARQSRLEAERDGRDEIVFPVDLLAMAGDSAEVARQIDGERTLFATRLEALTQQADLLAEQNAQIENRISGIEAQRTALDEQARLTAEELVDQEELLRQRLTQSGRVLELQRSAAAIAGQAGQLAAEIAELRGKSAENGIALLQLRTQRQEEAVSTLRDLQFRQIELAERQIALKETLSRLDIRTPLGGVVYNSQIFAVQAVIEPAQAIMYIVPQDGELQITTRVEATNIDEVFVGQEASLKFSAFDQRRLTDILGTVTLISADALRDERTGVDYYSLEITPGPGELAKLGAENTLLPGMPVEAFLKTGEHTVLAYLAEPLLGFFDRSFRE